MRIHLSRSDDAGSSKTGLLRWGAAGQYDSGQTRYQFGRWLGVNVANATRVRSIGPNTNGNARSLLTAAIRKPTTAKSPANAPSLRIKRLRAGFRWSFTAITLLLESRHRRPAADPTLVYGYTT